MFQLAFTTKKQTKDTTHSN